MIHLLWNQTSAVKFLDVALCNVNVAIDCTAMCAVESVKKLWHS